MLDKPKHTPEGSQKTPEGSERKPHIDAITNMITKAIIDTLMFEIRTKEGVDSDKKIDKRAMLIKVQEVIKGWGIEVPEVVALLFDEITSVTFDESYSCFTFHLDKLGIDGDQFNTAVRELRACIHQQKLEKGEGGKIIEALNTEPIYFPEDTWVLDITEHKGHKGVILRYMIARDKWAKKQ